MSAAVKAAVTVKINASTQAGVPVKLEWLPFLLNPSYPDDKEENIMDYLSKKYGPSAAARFNDPNSSLMTMGRAVNINFTNERNVHNTKRAHALVEHIKDAKSNDAANKFMEELYEAYFEHGKNINNIDLLVEMVSSHGIAEEEAKSAMKKVGDIAAKDQDVKREYGVSGVPFYMIYPNKGGKPLTFSGAYPVDVIAEQLEEAASTD